MIAWDQEWIMMPLDFGAPQWHTVLMEPGFFFFFLNPGVLVNTSGVMSPTSLLIRMVMIDISWFNSHSTSFLFSSIGYILLH